MSCGVISSESEIVLDIHSAAYAGDEDAVQLSIQRYNLNRHNKEGWTPLMYACSGQRVQVVDFLLRNGASAEISGTRGLTPLMVSSRRGDLQTMEILLRHCLSKKEYVEFKDSNGWNALFHAVYMGQEDAVKYLLMKGANSNAVDASNFSVLTMAASMREKKGGNSFKLLIEAGADFLSPRRETTLILQRSGKPKDLLSLFKLLGIEKYWKMFGDRNIEIEQFLMLTEADLKVLGVTLLGPRRKMVAAISQLRMKI